MQQVRLVHEWRRFPFLDPDLPGELLPRDWSGYRAAELFHHLHEQWRLGGLVVVDGPDGGLRPDGGTVRRTLTVVGSLLYGA